jgi:DNA-directed RNA polymerase specialized sigma24 family protein
LVLPDRARLAVRNRRVTEIRRAGRTSIDEPPDVGSPGDPRSSAGLLATAIFDATKAGALGPGTARAVFLTRVVGYTPTEVATRMGTSPGTVRALRSRGAQRLAAHLGLDLPETLTKPGRVCRTRDLDEVRPVGGVRGWDGVAA